MMKYEERPDEETYNQKLDEQLNKIGKIEGDNKDEVTVEGHRWKIDRVEPKILDYLGEADGIEITYTITGNDTWTKAAKTITANVTVKNNKGALDTSSIIIKKKLENGSETDITSSVTINSNGTFALTTTEVEETVFTVSAKSSKGKQSTPKTIKIIPKIDTTAPTLSNPTAIVDANRIKISAIAVDNESGLKQIEYSIEPTTVDSYKGTLISGQEIELKTTVGGDYTIVFTAEDNAGNKSESQTKTVETVGVIKHIKTLEGLKEVNTAEIYGSDVLGYTCGRSNIQWQLFYIDEEDNNRVYLIAKDYMVPPTTGTELEHLTNSNYPKAYWWNNTVLNKFKTTILNNNFTRKYLSEYANTSASGQKNLQATNYMLDQTMWREYMSSNGKSDYVFGGPTLSLFKASYNDVCIKATKLEYQKSGTGYQVKKGTGNFDCYVYLNAGYKETLNRMYFYGNSENSAFGMWLASPSAKGDEFNFTVLRHRYVGFEPITDERMCGFRPIIALKTSVQFINNGNGTYTIK